MRRLVLGVLTFLAATCFLGRGLFLQAGSEETVLSRVVTHLSQSPIEVNAVFPPETKLKLRSRVLVDTGHGLRMVGTLSSFSSIEEGFSAKFLIFPDKGHLLHEDSSLLAHETEGNVAWVVQTLLPQEHIEEIKARLLSTWEKERARLWEELKPGLLQVLKELGVALKEEFPILLKEHQEDFQVLGDVLRQRAWDEHMEPVFVETIWPMMEERAAPVISSVGDEIISEAPVWSLYWAYLREKVSGGGDEKHLQKRVGKFLTDKAVPILERHSPEFRKTLQELLLEVAGNEAVQGALQESISHAAADPRLKEALGTILEAWVLGSGRVQSILEEALTRPDLREPLSHTLDGFEKDIHKIANLILLNAEGRGINPDLARVLRNRLMREDESWVLLEPGTGAEWTGGSIRGIDGGTR